MHNFLLILVILFIPAIALAGPNITGVSGTVTHGSTITISGTGFGTKSNPAQTVSAAPLAWDIVSEQYVGGVNKNAYAGLTDGSSLNTTGGGKVWQDIQGGDATVRYSTSRAQRNPHITAHYAVYNESSSYLKLWLGRLVYPGGDLFPPATQKCFYLSFYRKVKNPTQSQGGGDGSCKILRATSVHSPDVSGFAILSHMLYGTYYTSTGEGITSWVDAGNETDWVRWEIYLDANRKWFDVYKNGHYHQGSWSSVPGNLEMRPAADWRFTIPGKSGYEFNVPPADFPAGDGLDAALFGYDDGHSLSGGQEIDMGEIYFDNTPARVEISSQSTWNDSPGNVSLHREVQGRLLSWSTNTIFMAVNQGTFAGGNNAYLYVIDSDGNVNQNGYPIIFGADTSPPAAPTGLAVQ
jgi:hypothetical protein